MEIPPLETRREIKLKARYWKQKSDEISDEINF